MLIEMKNISELMIDLAYSALIYDNKEIAEEVKYLEEKIDETYERIQELAIQTAIETKNSAIALVIIRLATSIEAISDSAVQIAEVVLRDIPPHPILRESIREGDITIVLGRVSKKSVLANKTLGELNLASETGMWVIAIKRDKKWIFGPTENTKLLPGDRLIAKGPVGGVKHFLNLCSGATHKI
ncbi:MAG: PhoU family transcriptional regulator [Euryarchaeota archaeon]|nr:PhoU family transcriptional regulator [Euryarchaeota archaeon]